MGEKQLAEKRAVGLMRLGCQPQVQDGKNGSVLMCCPGTSRHMLTLHWKVSHFFQDQEFVPSPLTMYLVPCHARSES